MEHIENSAPQENSDSLSPEEINYFTSRGESPLVEDFSEKNQGVSHDSGVDQKIDDQNQNFKPVDRTTGSIWTQDQIDQFLSAAPDHQEILAARQVLKNDQDYNLVAQIASNRQVAAAELDRISDDFFKLSRSNSAEDQHKALNILNNFQAESLNIAKNIENFFLESERNNFAQNQTILGICSDWENQLGQAAKNPEFCEKFKAANDFQTSIFNKLAEKNPAIKSDEGWRNFCAQMVISSQAIAKSLGVSPQNYLEAIFEAGKNAFSVEKKPVATNNIVRLKDAAARSAGLTGSSGSGQVSEISEILAMNDWDLAEINSKNPKMFEKILKGRGK